MPEGTAEVLARWLEALAGHFEARLSRSAAGFQLEGASERWHRFVVNLGTPPKCEVVGDQPAASMVVATEPSTREEWRDRLRLVERSAARTLTNAPVGFSVVFPHAAAGRSRPLVVRLAFGLSLSLGHRLRQRFTAYCLGSSGTAFFRRGDDSLLTLGATLRPLDLDRRELPAALSAISAAVGEAQEAYRRAPEVVTELERLRKSYAEELRGLERLYTSNWGQDARLLGLPSVGLKGDDAVEAEYVNRLEDLVDRYRPRVLFEPLTVGLVEGWDEAGLLAGRL